MGYFYRYFILSSSSYTNRNHPKTPALITSSFPVHLVLGLLFTKPTEAIELFKYRNLLNNLGTQVSKKKNEQG